MNPFTLYGSLALAAVLGLFGLYRYGYHVGWLDRDAEMQAVIAARNEEARTKERAMAEQINNHAVKLEEANHAIAEKSSALDRAIRAGRVRLPAASCVQASASPAAAPGGGDEAGGQPHAAPDGPADPERETLAAIAAIVAQGDRNTAQLNACIDAYNAVREQVNGQR